MPHAGSQAHSLGAHVARLTHEREKGHEPRSRCHATAADLAQGYRRRPRLRHNASSWPVAAPFFRLARAAFGEPGGGGAPDRVVRQENRRCRSKLVPLRDWNFSNRDVFNKMVRSDGYGAEWKPR